MCANVHTSQAMQSAQPQPAEIGDRGLAADGGEVAVVAVAERADVRRAPRRARRITLAT